MIYFTSDLHFSHVNIRVYCQRPWDSTEDMNQGLVDRWNARVRSNDHVYVLGDFLMGSDKVKNIHVWTKKLNGIKHLVMGNHDILNPHAYTNAGWHTVHEKSLDLRLITKKHGLIDVRLQHKPPFMIENNYNYILHGHVHKTYANKGIMINVGVDVRDYEPKTLEELIVGIQPAQKGDIYECMGCGMKTPSITQTCSIECSKKLYEDEHERNRH